jgi:hypothetical protein
MTEPTKSGTADKLAWVRARLPMAGNLSAGLLRLFLAVALFLYPAYVTISVVFSQSIRTQARPANIGSLFESTAGRYIRWADDYVDSRRPSSVSSDDVAATEWPMFGSVFLMLSAEELLRDGAIALEGPTKEAIEAAAKVIAHPSTGTWVKQKWGEHYLERENVFYRMLLILGLSSYQRMTGDVRHEALLSSQALSLGAELLETTAALADDYPGECYPTDVLWAVAALKRASAMGIGDPKDIALLEKGLLATLNGPSSTATGLPSFRVEAATGTPMQPARGSGNSGILSLATELDLANAKRWFDNYVTHYWEDGPILVGFREAPHGSDGFADIDSGPVVFGVGSVATGFGIGAARGVGRFDHAVPIAMETVAASWPTPFGLFLPGWLGWIAADGWCFGELALLFSMTRPVHGDVVVPYDGGIPGLVWMFLAFYLFVGCELCWRGAHQIHGATKRLMSADGGVGEGELELPAPILQTAAAALAHVVLRLVVSQPAAKP